ncbi:hypothetical protein [Mumia zhuanghuii]|uniref:Uncharacterized protein n=1 Tax=Mumia zhuanghuii TaxID=2585211 RepID=A0A5C4LUE5_9ACTN|nr:hypothetical protein [Mumia zhuanghuii]TNC22034.1 hypothetical protein FHE65_36175 [Mumia zhuanghuii]TNC22189.1 hypothetical protein FHE65_35920 [Mumia zhuanghuii]
MVSFVVERMQLPRLCRELVYRLRALLLSEPCQLDDLFLERKLERPVHLVSHKTGLYRGLPPLFGQPLERRRDLLKKPSKLFKARVKLRSREP